MVYGIVYGIAHVIPGLSGGTFLVIFGCYDMVCEMFALNIRVIKKHRYFLLLFAIGTLGGLFGFAHAITYLLDGFRIQINLFFMGLILGGIPLIAKTATEEEKFKPVCLLPFVLGFALVLALFLAERSGAFGTGALQSYDLMFSVKIVLYSILAAVAMVMPGISGAFVLVAFGVYDLFMEAIKGLDLMVLVPAVVGVLVGIVAGAKLVLLVLKKARLIVYSAILGMVIGSVAPLLPDGLGLNAGTLAGAACLALGAAVAYFMGRMENKAK